MSAGVPVIASDWKYNSEFVVPGKTGVIIENCNAERLAEELINIAAAPEKWNSMRLSSLKESEKYKPDIAARPQKDFALRVGLAARTAAGKHLSQRRLANALKKGRFLCFHPQRPLLPLDVVDLEIDALARLIQRFLQIAGELLIVQQRHHLGRIAGASLGAEFAQQRIHRLCHRVAAADIIGGRVQ